jgi:hypothetical protein
VASNNPSNRKLTSRQQQTQAMEKQESKVRFPTFPQHDYEL